MSARRPTRRDEDRRVALEDDGRAGHRLVKRKPRPIEVSDRERGELAVLVEDALALPEKRLLERSRGRRNLRHLRPLSGRGDAQVDDLDRIAERVAVFLLVEAVELVERLRRKAALGHPDAQLVALPHVPAVEPALEINVRVRNSVAPQPLAQLLLQLGERPGQAADVEVALEHEDRPHLVVLEVAGQEAGRGRDAWVRWNEHLRDSERLGQLGCVERPGAAERDEREVARVVAPLDGERANQAGHIRVRDRQDSLRRLEQVEPEAVGKPLHDLGGGVAVETHVPTEEPVGIDPPEDDVRVRHGRLPAALSIARRPGPGASAPRAYAEGAALVDIRDRAAAGADRLDIEHRDEKWVARHLGVTC